MTARHRRYLAGFIRARRPRTITTYAVHALDNSREEILPSRGRNEDPNRPWPASHREAAVDDPWLAPAKSEAVQALSILISSAQAHTLVDEPIEASLDLRGFCEDADLSPRETDILVLAGDGWRQAEIASWLEINQATVSRRLSTARAKLAGWLPLEVVHRLAVA